MQAFPEFRHMPMAFWAMIKYVSETLGYTVRGQGIVYRGSKTARH